MAKLVGVTSRKKIIPKTWYDALHPMLATRTEANGVNINCPVGLPESAKPKALPVVSGNHGANTAVLEKDEIDV